MSDVAVIVPWRPGCPHREAAWSWVRDRHERAGRPVVEGAVPEGPWVKALAITTALEHTDADILVIADADVWVNDFDRSVAAVRSGAAWAMPHTPVHRLTSNATSTWLANGPVDIADRQKLDQPPYRGWLGGGIVVLTRATWDAVPMDPRFTGWGQEDESFARALTVLAGPVDRGNERLVHLWHPPQERLGRRVGNKANADLAERYRRARRDPVAMRELLDESRGAARWASSAASSSTATQSSSS